MTKTNMTAIRLLNPHDADTVISFLNVDNPAGVWSARHIAAVFNAPHEYVRLDDAGPYICRVSINPQKPEVVVVWLLPSATQAALRPVFKAAIIAAADAEPAALLYPVRGDFYLPTKIAAQTKAGAYEQLFLGSSVTTIKQPDGRWIGRITMPTFGAAVAVMRTWL